MSFVSFATTEKPQKRFAGTHIAIVVNNKDPKKVGCVQVRIPGLIDGPNPVLPWATPIMPISLGGNANAQQMSVPNVGARITVKVIDQYTIQYSGWMPSEITKNDKMNEDYPDTYGAVDEQGTGWRINKKQQYIEVTHSSGSKVILNKQGDILMTAARDITLQAGRHINIKAPNNITIEATSALALKGESSTYDSKSGTTIKSGGALTIKGSPTAIN